LVSRRIAAWARFASSSFMPNGASSSLTSATSPASRATLRQSFERSRPREYRLSSPR
jgi:hypothetical protein